MTQTDNTNNDDIENKKGELNELINGANNLRETLEHQLGEAKKLLQGDENTDGLAEKAEKKLKEINAEIKKEHDEFLEQFKKEQNEKFETLSKKIEKEILSVLPTQATSAALASAYFDAKSKYGYTPKLIKEKDSNHWFLTKSSLFFHWILSHVGIILNYALFILPTIAISLIFFDLFHPNFLNTIFFDSKPQITLNIDSSLNNSNGGTGSPSQNETNFDVFPSQNIPSPDISDKNDIKFREIFARFLISSPLLLLALFGLSSIKLNRRLYEEYNHKQRVMEMYHGFKNELENYEENSESIDDNLLQAMLEVVKNNPSKIMSKYDEKGLPQTFWSALLTKISGSTKGANDKNPTE